MIRVCACVGDSLVDVTVKKKGAVLGVLNHFKCNRKSPGTQIFSPVIFDFQPTSHSEFPFACNISFQRLCYSHVWVSADICFVWTGGYLCLTHTNTQRHKRKGKLIQAEDALRIWADLSRLFHSERTLSKPGVWCLPLSRRWGPSLKKTIKRKGLAVGADGP